MDTKTKKQIILEEKIKELEKDINSELSEKGKSNLIDLTYTVKLLMVVANTSTTKQTDPDNNQCKKDFSEELEHMQKMQDRQEQARYHQQQMFFQQQQAQQQNMYHQQMQQQYTQGHYGNATNPQFQQRGNFNLQQSTEESFKKELAKHRKKIELLVNSNEVLIQEVEGLKGSIREINIKLIGL